jgi:hypothetical protein
MFTFRLYARDESFNPLCGKLPEHLHLLLGDQLERARQVLQHRSAAEISHTIESLEWLLRKSNQVFFDEIMQAVKKKGHAFSNRVKALRALMPHIDISRQKHLPKASWDDYFAALTFAYIQEVLHLEQTHAANQTAYAEADPIKQQMIDQMHRNHPSILCDYAIESMDAVCFAEHLAAQRLRKEVFRKAGAKGGRLKARPFDALKARCLKLHEENFSRRSNRAAAKKIYGALTETEKNIFNTPEPEGTIEKWIGQHKKSKS